MNDPKLQDALMLVSRLEEKGGDVRGLFRRDPDVQREIHAYLDDLNWLAGRPLIEPRFAAEAFGKAQLLDALARRKQPSSFFRWTKRGVGAAATLAVLLTAAFGAHATTSGLPQPIDRAWATISTVFQTGEGEASVAPASIEGGTAEYVSTGSASSP